MRAKVPEPMTAAVLEPLAWDSAFFGFPIARLAADALDSLELAAIRAALAEGPARCVYALIDGQDAARAHLLEALGFRWVDLRVTLSRGLGPAAGDVGAAGQLPPVKASLRSATAGDLPRLQALARAAHRDTRFYFDGRFASARCDELYAQWLANSLAGPGVAVLVADHGEGPMGYVTCEVRAAAAGDKFASIGLIAVDASARGGGVGTALIQGALAHAGSRGARRMEVVTQGRNVAAQRLYQRAGFVTQQVQAWYHAWPATEATP